MFCWPLGDSTTQIVIQEAIAKLWLQLRQCQSPLQPANERYAKWSVLLHDDGQCKHMPSAEAIGAMAARNRQPTDN